MPLRPGGDDGCGMCVAPLVSLSSYSAFGLRRPARRLGIALLAIRWSRVSRAAAARAWDAASAEAEALEMRLGLLDVAGAAVPSPRIALVDFPRRSPWTGTYVMADLGEAGAVHGAIQLTRPTSGGNASRPAA